MRPPIQGGRETGGRKARPTKEADVGSHGGAGFIPADGVSIGQLAGVKPAPPKEVDVGSHGGAGFIPADGVSIGQLAGVKPAPPSSRSDNWRA
jgi:hypothetical protein